MHLFQIWTFLELNISKIKIQINKIISRNKTENEETEKKQPRKEKQKWIVNAYELKLCLDDFVKKWTEKIHEQRLFLIDLYIYTSFKSKHF